nr:MAG TPA: hypothetical protein [Caudoviricetes sp.]
MVKKKMILRISMMHLYRKYLTENVYMFIKIKRTQEGLLIKN